MTRIIVTGGCGFIGSHLVEKFVKNKQSVLVLSTIITGSKLSIK